MTVGPFVCAVCACRTIRNHHALRHVTARDAHLSGSCAANLPVCPAHLHHHALDLSIAGARGGPAVRPRSDDCCPARGKTSSGRLGTLGRPALARLDAFWYQSASTNTSATPPRRTSASPMRKRKRHHESIGQRQEGLVAGQALTTGGLRRSAVTPAAPIAPATHRLAAQRELCEPPLVTNASAAPSARAPAKVNSNPGRWLRALANKKVCRATSAVTASHIASRSAM